MYAKLILRNAKRSVKDYLIYIVTLTLCVAMFYSFLSISSRYYKPDIGSEYNLNMLSGGMKIAILSISALLLFLIKYVNDFMIRRRQKEFAVQIIMGMEQKTTAGLFFFETILMGMVSLFWGIILGTLLSQVITAMLLSSYGRTFKLSMSLYPDTLLLTIVFFCIAFCVIGLFNVKTIRKVKVIDMLHADKKTETYSQSKWMPCLVGLFSAFAVMLLYKSVLLKMDFFDSRLAFPLHLMFWGNIIAPTAWLTILIVYMVCRMLKVKFSFSNFTILLMIASLIIVFFTKSVATNYQKYYLPFGSDTLNLYLIFAAGFLVFAICCFFYLVNNVISILKEKYVNIRYCQENLFLFGQITSRLKTSTKTMSLICVTLVVSIVLFILAPLLSGWAKGYLNIRSVYDIQIDSRYNNVTDETDLPAANYEFITNFLKNKGITVGGQCLFQTYLVNNKDFYNRNKYKFPVLAISLSDFNRLRSLQGLLPITLGDNEFTTQWYQTATEQEIKKYLQDNQRISTDSGILSISSNQYYQMHLGERVYNLYTNVLFIFPDDICSKLLGVEKHLYINTTSTVSYKDAVEMDKLFNLQINKMSGSTKNTYAININTLEVNSVTAGIFMIRSLMVYTAVVLLIICFTILALQQLSDSFDYRYRFGILRKLGVEHNRINKLVFKQIMIWFGLPVFLAVLVAAVLGIYIYQSFLTEIAAYIGTSTFIITIVEIAVILLILLCCYFVSTWLLFKRNIEIKEG